MCSLPSFLPRTNGINFFNSERGGKFNPSIPPSPRLTHETWKINTGLTILDFIFIVFVLRRQRFQRSSTTREEGPNEAIYFSSYSSSSSNAASPLFREMEITRIKCLHPPQCRNARSRSAVRPFYHRVLLLLQIFSNPSTVIRVYDRLVSE